MADKKFIITIGRERGSGGRMIGKKLAKRFGIGYYDREILTFASHELDVDEGFLASLDERSINVIHNVFPVPYNSLSFNYIPTTADLIGVQTRLIRDFAQKRSCVIVGRCADYILNDQPHVINIFLHADMEERAKHISEIYGISDSEALKKLKKLDSERAKYYRSQTGQVWGESRNYHLCLNTTTLGIDKSCDIIQSYVNEFLDKME